MKRTLLYNFFQILLILCFILISQFSVLNCSAQAYTVYECNFDNWTDGKPDGWNFISENTTVSQSAAFSGSYSCKVVGGTSVTLQTTANFPIYWGKKYTLCFTVKWLKGKVNSNGDPRTIIFSTTHKKSDPDPFKILHYLEKPMGNTIPIDDVWRDYEIEFVSNCYGTNINMNAPISSFNNNISITIKGDPTDGVEFIIDRIKLVAKDHTMEFDYLEVNNLKAYIDPTVPFLNCPSFNINYFEVPKNSKKSTFFASNIWLAGLDTEEKLHVAAHRYCQLGKDFWIGPTTNDYEVIDGEKVYSDAYIQRYYHTWKVSKEEIAYHKVHYADANYVIPWSIAHWPAHGRIEFGETQNLAPYKNVAGNSSYEPALGDYPDIRGDQAVFFILNDAMDEHTETKGMPFNFDILGMVYAFNSANSALQNTIFLSYELLNKSPNDYNNFYFGFFTDFDIGYADDDYVGCDTMLNLGYGYNGNEIDGFGENWAYGENPPVQGAMFLNQKMSAFVSNPNIEEFDAIIYFNLLRARWRNGAHITYGGNGDNQNSTDYTNFMYSGDPVSKTGWTEFTPYGEGSQPHYPYNRCAVMSSGPYTFPAGERLRLDIALPFAHDNETTNYLTSLTLLKQYASKIQKYYDENILEISEHNDIATGKILVYPNPTTGQLRITNYEFVPELNSGTNIEIFDIYGKRHALGATNNEYTINISHLPTGIYFIKISTEVGEVVKKVVKM